MPQVGARLHHDAMGVCILVGVEGTTWIVRPESSNVRYRVASALRHQYRPLNHEPQTLGTTDSVSVPGIRSRPTLNPEVQRAKRVIDSLRNGLPPVHTDASSFAVGFKEVQAAITTFLAAIDQPGGSALVIRGEYGQGKTFALKALEEAALAEGYVTARTEIDATENQLGKPHHVYRDLMRNLRLPRMSTPGVTELARQTTAAISRHINGLAEPEYRSVHGLNWLEDAQKLDCYPLAWLLSDPYVAEKPQLLGLLACEPDVRLADARNAHVWSTQECWPNFGSSTQGAFASYLLSGIGRLSRILGYKGFVVLMDEMENWQHLNWLAQSRAGNLLGGLIWGATARLGRRAEHHRPPSIQHSPRCKGFPFTTQPRCHLGIAVTMTPRGVHGPEELWSQYGPLTVTPLPHATADHLEELCEHVAAHYAKAFGLSPVKPDQLGRIRKDAVDRWRRGGTYTIRYGIQHVISAFDAWREK